MKVVKQLTSWSYSVYQDYLKCPLMVFFKRIQRVPVQEEESPVLARGNAVHSEAEVFVSTVAKAPKMPKSLAKFDETMKQLRKQKARTEIEWCFDEDYNPVSWRDWKRGWLRMKIDALTHTNKPPSVSIVDYKTGKFHVEHAQQRSLYALGGLRLVQIGELAGGDERATVKVQHLYTDLGKDSTENFVMNQLPELKREWGSRTKEMLADTKFRSKPGYHCRYCSYRKSAGGPCPENQ